MGLLKNKDKVINEYKVGSELARFLTKNRIELLSRIAVSSSTWLTISLSRGVVISPYFVNENVFYASVRAVHDLFKEAGETRAVKTIYDIIREMPKSDLVLAMLYENTTAVKMYLEKEKEVEGKLKAGIGVEFAGVSASAKEGHSETERTETEIKGSLRQFARSLIVKYLASYKKPLILVIPGNFLDLIGADTVSEIVNGSASEETNITGSPKVVVMITPPTKRSVEYAKLLRDYRVPVNTVKDVVTYSLDMITDVMDEMKVSETVKSVFKILRRGLDVLTGRMPIAVEDVATAIYDKQTSGVEDMYGDPTYVASLILETLCTNRVLITRVLREYNRVDERRKNIVAAEFTAMVMKLIASNIARNKYPAGSIEITRSLAMLCGSNWRKTEEALKQLSVAGRVRLQYDKKVYKFFKLLEDMGLVVIRNEGNGVYSVESRDYWFIGSMYRY
ncbi:MAG: hypothetical protein GXO26_03240 [Crenarchaeota archaeon]|nr:hypothetical protein [Thermoproteota archaeon]